MSFLATFPPERSVSCLCTSSTANQYHPLNDSHARITFLSLIYGEKNGDSQKIRKIRQKFVNLVVVGGIEVG
jgi:hypothetical protein